MKPEDTTNPEVLKFLEQCYDRENAGRIRWNIKNKNATRKAAQYKTEPKHYTAVDTVRTALEIQIPDITKQFKVSSRNRLLKGKTDNERIQGIKYLRHENSIANTGLGDPKEDPRLARPDTDLSLDPIMRPVDPKIAKILYKTQPPRRQTYLKKRLELLPDKKYYYPQTTYMEYGWRLNDFHLIRHQKMNTK